jgi:hypothetical protein
LLALSNIINKLGTKNNTNTVANNNPKEIETAIGIKNWACVDVSNNKGVRPAIVVAEVSPTALNLWQDASIKASFFTKVFLA